VAAVAAAEEEEAVVVATDITAHSDDTASTISPLLPKNSPSPNPLLMN
jgi:hypothetical protein